MYRHVCIDSVIGISIDFSNAINYDHYIQLFINTYTYTDVRIKCITCIYLMWPLHSGLDNRNKLLSAFYIIGCELVGDSRWLNHWLSGDDMYDHTCVCNSPIRHQATNQTDLCGYVCVNKLTLPPLRMECKTDDELYCSHIDSLICCA